MQKTTFTEKLSNAGAALNKGLIAKYVPANAATTETKSWGPAMRI